MSSKDMEGYEYSKDLDIVFVKVDNNLKLETAEIMRGVMQSLRKEHELLPVYFIEDSVTDIKVIDMINNCYCLDGLLPTPFVKEKVYRFLYRVLKRITTIKDLNSYLGYLEEKLYPTEIKTKEVKPTRDKSKISALEFMDMLDDGIVDKVEDMEIALDSLIGAIYRLERLDALSSIKVMRENIEPIIENVFNLVESIGYFSVAARAFKSLSTFLSMLGAEELENSANKVLLVQMLLRRYTLS